MNKANKGVRALKNEMKRVTIDPDILPAEKRRQLDALTQQKNDYLESVVTQVEDSRE